MGSTVQVELGDAIEEHPCQCCRRTIRSGRGFVFEHEGMSALYWFDMHRRGDDRRVRLLVALGRRRRGPEFRPRVSFTVHGRVDPGGIAFALCDPDSAPVIPRRDVTGHALTRRRALRHPERRRLWQIVDVLIEEDPALAAFLDGTSG